MLVLKIKADPTRLADTSLFLQRLQPAQVCFGPEIVRRATGTVISFSTDVEHVSLIIAGSDATLIVHSLRTIDEYKYLEGFARYAQIPVTRVRIHDVALRAAECQEPRCTRPATGELNGLMLCSDHLEQWEERENEDRRITRRYS